jgi:hypothetical protein
MTRKIFINRRRKNSERREDDDPCRDMSIDIYHRKRRKAAERRKPRTLDEDYYAFLSSAQSENDDLGDGRQH